MSEDSKTFRKGDEVSWHTHGTTTRSAVEKKITEDTEAAARTVRASDDDPQYLVRTAVHKPDALTPTEQGS